jgi:hypothetical protein
VRSNTASCVVARRSTTYLWRPCGLDHSIIVIHRARRRPPSSSSSRVAVCASSVVTAITTSRAKKPLGVTSPVLARVVSTGSRVPWYCPGRDWWIPPDATSNGPTRARATSIGSRRAPSGQDARSGVPSGAYARVRETRIHIHERLMYTYRYVCT